MNAKKLFFFSICLIFISIMCFGCSPSGYVKGNNIPLNYGDTAATIYTLYNQFAEENDNSEESSICFVYGQEKYYLHSSVGTCLPIISDSEYIIYKAIEENTKGEKIGSFLNQIKDGSRKVSYYYSFIFFEEQFIYYMIGKSIHKFTLSCSVDPSLETQYTKYECYSFDLKTGQNEKISIDLFAEKIINIDKSIQLK